MECSLQSDASTPDDSRFITPGDYANPNSYQLRDGTGEAFEKVQSDFALAYNRKDVEAMATAFSEDAIRVTPAGIFQGREAIRHNLQDALKMGLHDYSVRRTISRSYGAFVFNVGEWQAKLGNERFHSPTLQSLVARVTK